MEEGWKLMDNKDANTIKKIDDMIESIEKIIYADNKTALKDAYCAYELSKKANYPQGEAILLLKIGFIYTNISEYDKGIDYIIQALSMLELYNLNYYIASAFIMLGNVFFELAYYENAYDYYNKSLFISNKYEYSDRISIAYNNIGEIYKMLRDYDNAFLYYEKGLENDPIKACKGIAHINLAEVNYFLGDYDKALEILPVALELLTKHKYEIHFCEVYKIYALIYWKLKCYDKAGHYFTEAIAVADKKSVYFNKINILINYHEFLIDINEHQKAIDVLLDAYTLATANNIYEKTLQICFYLTSLYDKLGDNVLELKYYRLYVHYEQEQKKERVKQIIDGIELRIKTEEIKLQSEVDSLTNIPNRRKFLDYLEKQWEHSKKYSHWLSLIMLDIDFFKEFNDNYGHPEGDRCIKQIAGILNNLLNNKYLFSRYGGDEFIAVMPQTTLEEAHKYAEMMRTAIDDAKIPHKYSESCGFVTITLGVASIIPTDEISVNDFIKKVDGALYEAKDRGRNNVVCATNNL
jgi:diguanylate cyclase (GGDEF)-like protein